jgi:hypothetical protein
MTARLFAVLVLALLAVTACEKTYPAGPSGTVTDRASAYYKGAGWRFWLTVDGSKFRVSRDDYRGCVRGSAYPACTRKGK